MNHGTADVNGVRLHYAETGPAPDAGAGADGRRLVLFLHGFPEYWRAWEKVMAVVGRHFHAVAPDTRGVNLSTGPDEVEAYAVDRLVGDVAGLIAHFGRQKAVLVGHDWGGVVGWATAILRPDLLDGLVIVNCGHPGIFTELRHSGSQSGSGQAAASAYIETFRAPDFQDRLAASNYASFEEMLLRPALDAGHLTEAEAEGYRAAWRQPGAMRRALNYYRALSNRTPPLAATVVRVPTLVIWGDRDPYFVIDNVTRLPEVVPDLTLHRFPDNDHWIVHQRPAEVADLILDFARRTG